MSLTRGTNWPPWLKKRHVTNTGPNRPFRCLDIQAPIFCGLSICIWFCLGSVQSVILIATTKEGNILLSKCFLLHHYCLHHHGHPQNQHDNAQLTGNKQHNPPLYLPGLGSRLPHKLTEGFSSSSTPTCPLFEPLFHIFTNNLRKVQFRILKPSAPWALSNWTRKIIEISSVFWGTARLSRRKGLGELVHSPRHRSELLETSIFKKSFYIWFFGGFVFLQFHDLVVMQLLHPGTQLTGRLASLDLAKR